MVRKREDGRWEGRIVVGHKQNGAPIFRYVLAKTQKELLAKLHRDMEVYQDAQLTEDSRMTLGEYLDRWMAEYGALTLRPNTLRSYEQYIRCYIKPYLGGKIVSRVTRPDMSQRRGAGPHHPLQSHGRRLRAQGLQQTQADPGPGADGRLLKSGGRQRGLAGLLLHGADHRTAAGRDLRAHVAGLR